MDEKLKSALLTKQQAMELALPAEVWIEEIIGSEGTRHMAVKVTAYAKTAYGLFFRGRDGRGWAGYNRKYLGWRLWDTKPTHEEQMEMEWKEG